MMIDKMCYECSVKLRKTYVGDASEKFDYCISCPECHVIFDLIRKKKRA